MSGGGAVVLGGLLFGVFLLIVAAMLWQEARERGNPTEAVFGIEDATDHILTVLPEAVASRLGRDNVRRIIEWQVRFLQDLARDDDDVPIVVGTTEGTVEFIGMRLEKAGHPIAASDVAAVLDAQGEYLAGLGVIGEAADETDVFGGEATAADDS